MESGCRFITPEYDKKILLIQEDAVDTSKHMDPQQLVNILLPDDDWYVKNSNGNASGSLTNIANIQIQACLYKREEQKYFMWKVTEIFKP